MATMIRNVLANLFSRPATRRYPAERREPFAEARGKITFDISRCAFCGACAKRCPSGAIDVQRSEKELVFQPFKCIICEACVEVCPRDCVNSVAQYRAPAYAKSEEVYKASLS